MASAHLKSVCSKSLFSHCLPSNLQNLLFLYNFHVILFNNDNKQDDSRLKDLKSKQPEKKDSSPYWPMSNLYACLDDQVILFFNTARAAAAQCDKNSVLWILSACYISQSNKTGLNHACFGLCDCGIILKRAHMRIR